MWNAFQKSDMELDRHLADVLRSRTGVWNLAVVFRNYTVLGIRNCSWKETDLWGRGKPQLNRRMATGSQVGAIGGYHSENNTQKNAKTAITERMTNNAARWALSKYANYCSTRSTWLEKASATLFIHVSQVRCFLSQLSLLYFGKHWRTACR